MTMTTTTLPNDQWQFSLTNLEIDFSGYDPLDESMSEFQEDEGDDDGLDARWETSEQYLRQSLRSLSNSGGEGNLKQSLRSFGSSHLSSSLRSNSSNHHKNNNNNNDDFTLPRSNSVGTNFSSGALSNKTGSGSRSSGRRGGLERRSGCIQKRMSLGPPVQPQRQSSSRKLVMPDDEEDETIPTTPSSSTSSTVRPSNNNREFPRFGGLRRKRPVPPRT